MPSHERRLSRQGVSPIKHERAFGGAEGVEIRKAAEQHTIKAGYRNLWRDRGAEPCGKRRAACLRNMHEA
jgi:hypothetical protein